MRIMKNRGSGKTKTIDMRISNALKKALESFCRKNLQTSSEAVTHAIKQFIGFGQINPPKRKVAKINLDKKKNKRLQIRIHPRLKNQFAKFCKSSGIENHSVALTEAIRIYVGT